LVSAGPEAKVEPCGKVELGQAGRSCKLAAASIHGDPARFGTALLIGLRCIRALGGRMPRRTFSD
jgi:hypothetical protein